jgi:8-oxo-dGTP pyrophosphatase MutT (NUDIX family)/phosphohistidine phosphatase SixA
MAKSTGPIRASGVVLLRQEAGVTWVCVLHRPRQNDWSLPKGKLDPGENEIVAARRETIEETGSDVVLGVPLTTQRYKVETRPKSVHYWVGTERPGGPGFTPNKEIDELRWLPAEAAINMLSYPRDGDLVREALRQPSTSPFILLRHTEAMRRGDYKGAVDAERPLTPSGAAHAARLVGVLEAFGIRKVYSSDSRRCLDTVRPFAHYAHATVAHEPLLSEEGFTSSPTAALKRLDQILGDGAPAVVCTHRPVLPTVVAHVAQRLGLSASPKSTAGAGCGSGLPPWLHSRGAHRRVLNGVARRGHRATFHHGMLTLPERTRELQVAVKIFPVGVVVCSPSRHRSTQCRVMRDP